MRDYNDPGVIQYLELKIICSHQYSYNNCTYDFVFWHCVIDVNVIKIKWCTNNCKPKLVNGPAE